MKLTQIVISSIKPMIELHQSSLVKLKCMVTLMLLKSDQAAAVVLADQVATEIVLR